MPNLTVSLSATVLERARSYAAQRQLSLSKLIEMRLSEFLEGPSTDAPRVDILRRFSAGNIARRQAMELLSIEDYGSLITEMRSVGLPLPTRSDAIAESSIEIAQSLLEQRS